MQLKRKTPLNRSDPNDRTVALGLAAGGAYCNARGAGEDTGGGADGGLTGIPQRNIIEFR